MSLKLRKLANMLEEYNKECAEKFNEQFSSDFTFKFNADVIPANIEGWGREDGDLKKCYHISYFQPFEIVFEDLFKDPMYKEEIQKQVKTISFNGCDSMYANLDFNEGNIELKFTMSVNHFVDPASYLEAATNQMKSLIDNELS